MRPFGKPFKVTPKGTGNEANSFDAYTFAWIAGFIAVTALGLLINLVPETAQVQGSFSAIGAVWSVINIVVLVIASLICFEKPRRLFQAFKLDEPVKVDGTPGRVVSLSLGEAVVAVPEEVRFQSAQVTLRLDGFEPLQADLRQVTQRRGDISRAGDKRRFYLQFIMTSVARSATR